MAGYLGSRPVVVQVDGYQREESESRYVNVSGDDFSGHLDFVDDAKARFGSSDELHIYTESSGSGHSYIQGDNIVIRSAAGTARLTVTSNDVDVSSGALKVGGTTVIDSSREGTLQRLNVTAATGLSSLATTTNAFTIGSTSDYNMAFDPNEIQARNNGAANNLVLQKNGGSVGIQTTAPATMLQVGDAGGTSTSRQRSIRLSHQTGQSSEYGGIEFYRAHQNSQKIGAAIIHQRPGTALDDSNLLFKTSTANQNATTRMTLTHDGKLGIGESDTQGFRVRVDGAIKLGTSGVTLGSTMLTGNYADGQEGWNIGSEYSTAAIQLMYGVKPSTTAANTYISSVDNANWKRSVLKTGENLSFQTAGAQNTSIGTAVALTERFSVLADGRTTITSTGSPALQVNSNADSARAIVANTDGTATFSYLELSTSSYGPGYLIKNIANSGNGMNNGSLYLWNSDNSGSGAIEFVPNQTIANRTTVEENGDLKVRGRIGVDCSPETASKLEINAGSDGAVAISARSDGGNGNNRRFNIIPYADGGTYGGGVKIETRNSSNIFNTSVTLDSTGNMTVAGHISSPDYIKRKITNYSNSGSETYKVLKFNFGDNSGSGANNQWLYRLMGNGHIGSGSNIMFVYDLLVSRRTNYAAGSWTWKPMRMDFPPSSDKLFFWYKNETYRRDLYVVLPDAYASIIIYSGNEAPQGRFRKSSEVNISVASVNDSNYSSSLSLTGQITAHKISYTTE
jgi:hypothetical protein